MLGAPQATNGDSACGAIERLGLPGADTIETVVRADTHVPQGRQVELIGLDRGSAAPHR